MKIRLAIALLLLLPQTVLAGSFRDATRVVIRGLPPSTKYRVEYQQKIPIWRRYTVDRCGTINIKGNKGAGYFASLNNFEFRADDEEKTISYGSISTAQINAAKSRINWNSKDSEKLGYRCTNGEINPNLEPYWVSIGGGMRIHYRIVPYAQNQNVYITGIDSSNVHLRQIPDRWDPGMKRTIRSDKCGQLIIKHNEKYPASALGYFYIKDIVLGDPYGGSERGFNFENISQTASDTKCKAPYTPIP